MSADPYAKVLRRTYERSVLGMKVRRYGDRLLICLGNHADEVPCDWRWWGPLGAESVEPPGRIWPDRYLGEDAYLNGYTEMAIRPEWELLDDLTYGYVSGQLMLARLWVELDAVVMVASVTALELVQESGARELIQLAQETPV